MKAGVTEILDSGRAAILCADGYQQATDEWFWPEYWGAEATPVGVGGRGSAWFIEHEPVELVLRHYLRGGMMARLSHRSFLFFGFERTRSFVEFRLLEALRRRKLPVPMPVAAYAYRTGQRRYQAAILVEKLEAAVSLPEHTASDSEALWFNVGKTVARFHSEGLDHVDLNCDNVLVAEDRIYLIDFDRCRLRQSAPGAAWKRRNLERLRRSMDKRFCQMKEGERNALWYSCLAGYRTC